MKALVVGGSGFIGSHVADELSERGYEVTIFDIRKSEYLRDDQKMIVGDILDEESILKSVSGNDIVYNLASLADLDAAAKLPLDTIKLNILGNCNILEACRKEGVKRFVYSSTIYVYSDLGGFYRCSKQAAETYIEEYCRKYDLDYTVLRYGTVYGPRSDEKNSIYRYIKEALETGRIRCPGTGNEIREYVHVKDVAKLSVDILDEKYAEKYITITGQHPTKYEDMINTIKEILGNHIETEFTGIKSNSAHYKLTPYSFTPKIGRKLVSNYYIDLGQGLLECIEEIKAKTDA